MIENTSPKQNLDKIGVLIEDTDPKSLYFNITMPDVLPGGKTAISIDPPPALLKLSSQVKVEVLDVNGNPVYVEFPNDPWVDAYEHGYKASEDATNRYLSVTLYPSTPYGYGEIIVVGEALKIMPMGIPVPAAWQGVYNVRWRKKILLDRNTRNDSPIIFYKTPQVYVTEIQKPYLNQTYLTSRVVTQSGTITYAAGYDYAIVTAVDFDFTADMVGGLLTVPSPTVSDDSITFRGRPKGIVGRYVTNIDSLINKKQAYVRDVYVLTKNPDAGYLSPADTRKYLGVKQFSDSSCTLQYNASPSYVTSPNLKSFAKFDITNLDTFSGDVARLKVFQGSEGVMGGYKVVAEKNLEDTEILFNHDAVDPTYQYMGVFVGSQIFNSYWSASGYDFDTGGGTSFSPIITFDSNTLMNGMVISSSKAWDDDNGRVIQFVFPTTQSYFNKGDQLEVRFKLANLSGDGTFDMYASGSAFYQNYRRLAKDWGGGERGTSLLYKTMFSGGEGDPSWVNKFGKLITSINPDATGDFKTRKKLYGLITAPIQTDWSGSGSINIAVHGGQWAVSDVSFVYKRETNFSPSAYTFSIPLVPEQEGDAVSFGVKYYNSLGQEVVIPKTPSPNAPPNMTMGTWTNNQNLSNTGEYWAGTGEGKSKKVTGPNTYIDGTRNVMSGSLWIASQVGHYRYGDIIASGGMEFSVDAAPGPSGSIGKGALMRNIGYEGMYRASKGFGTPGFMIWSGSILPGSGDTPPYSGAGIEFWGSGSSLHFDTTSGILSITGSINATSGTIGGWEILTEELRSYPLRNMSLSGSGAGYIIARDKDLIDRVFFGITPDTVTGSDTWRDPNTVVGTEMRSSSMEQYQGAIDAEADFKWHYNYGISGWSFPTVYGDRPIDVYLSGSGQLPPAQNGTVAMWMQGTGGGEGDLFLVQAKFGELSQSVITRNTTYNFSFWTYGVGTDANADTLTFAVGQQVGSAWTRVLSENVVVTPSTWKQSVHQYTTADSALGEGALTFEVTWSSERRGAAIIFDEFSVKGVGYFTDVSQNGLYIFSSPSSYIKLGKGALARASFNEISASKIRVFDNIDVDGYLTTDYGIVMGFGVTGSVRWAGGIISDYYTTYFDVTSSLRGSEVVFGGEGRLDKDGGGVTDTAYGTWGDTDYNIYFRNGGGGSSGKNRGWVFADSSYLGHTPAVHIQVGRDGWLAGEVISQAVGGILVNGPIWTFNTAIPNRMNKLLITGSWYTSNDNPPNYYSVIPVAPSFQFVDGNQALGKALISSATGVASWGVPATASYAVTASYVSGSSSGGVTQIVAGTNITIDPVGGTGVVTINSTGGGGGGSGTGMNWIYTESDVTMSENIGYITSGSNVTLCLPSGSQTGSIFEVVGRDGRWRITHNSNPATQQIFFGNMSTTSGPSGYLSSSLAKDSIRLVCVSASYEFNVVSAVGNIEVM